MNELRRFTETGLTAARELIDRMRQGETDDLEPLLYSEHHTTVMSRSVSFDVQEFANRFDAARYFDGLLRPIATQYPELDMDAGLWTWLSFRWLEVLAPLNQETGLRKLAADQRYILAPNDYRTYYRHYLSGPYRIYKAHKANPEAARAVLATPLTSPGEVVEQIASNQEIISNTTLMAVVTELYLDPVTDQLKRGSGGRSGGSARRLADVLAQFDQTWDSSTMSAQEIIGLLPAEFDRFRPA